MILLVSLLLFSIFIFVYFNFFIFRVFSEDRVFVNFCYDNDGNDIYNNGSGTYNLISSEGEYLNFEYKEYCNFSHNKADSRVGLVKEYYCSGFYLRSKLLSCGFNEICRQGKCIKGSKSTKICYDSEQNKNVFEKGVVSGYETDFFDTCWVIINESSREGKYTKECEESDVKTSNCFVYEYYCDEISDSKNYEIIKCQNGCKNGVCL